MKKLIRLLLGLMMAIFMISTVAIAAGAVYVSKYRGFGVDPSLLSVAHSSSQTKFYCYDFSDREGRIGEAKIIESASLGCGIKYEYVSYNEIPEYLIKAFIGFHKTQSFHKALFPNNVFFVNHNGKASILIN